MIQSKLSLLWVIEVTLAVVRFGWGDVPYTITTTVAVHKLCECIWHPPIPEFHTEDAPTYPSGAGISCGPGFPDENEFHYPFPVSYILPTPQAGKKTTEKFEQKWVVSGGIGDSTIVMGANRGICIDFDQMVTHVDPSEVQCPCHDFSGTQTSENTNWASGGYNLPPDKKAVEKHIQQWDNVDSINFCEGTTPGWCIEGGTYHGHYFVAEIKDC